MKKKLHIISQMLYPNKLSIRRKQYWTWIRKIIKGMVFVDFYLHCTHISQILRKLKKQTKQSKSLMMKHRARFTSINFYVLIYLFFAMRICIWHCDQRRKPTLIMMTEMIEKYILPVNLALFELNNKIMRFLVPQLK